MLLAAVRTGSVAKATRRKPSRPGVPSGHQRRRKKQTQDKRKSTDRHAAFFPFFRFFFFFPFLLCLLFLLRKKDGTTHTSRLDPGTRRTSCFRFRLTVISPERDQSRVLAPAFPSWCKSSESRRSGHQQTDTNTRRPTFTRQTPQRKNIIKAV